MGQDEIKENLLFAVEAGADLNFGLRGPLFPGQRRQCVGDVGQHVEEVALLGINDLLHFRHLLFAETFLGQTLQQLGAGIGGAPEGAELGLILEELGNLPKSNSMNCCADMGVPSGCQKLVAIMC